MADYSQYKPIIGTLDYVQKYQDLVDETQDRATEIENAREEEDDLVTNLQNNYVNYTLTADINGNNTTGVANGASATTLSVASPLFNSGMVGLDVWNVTEDVIVEIVSYITPYLIQTEAVTNWTGDSFVIFDGNKCTNMKSGTLPSDYVTKSQVDGLTASDVPTDITDLNPGTLLSNQIVVVDSAGNNIVGRDTTYTKITTTPFTVAYNKMYDMNITGARTINLPAGDPGGIIGFADIDGNAGNYTITISPDGTDKMMGSAQDLTVDDFQNISFKLVYTGATFGWVVTELQR